MGYNVSMMNDISKALEILDQRERNIRAYLASFKHRPVPAPIRKMATLSLDQISLSRQKLYAEAV